MGSHLIFVPERCPASVSGLWTANFCSLSKNLSISQEQLGVPLAEVKVIPVQMSWNGRRICPWVDLFGIGFGYQAVVMSGLVSADFV